MQLTRYFCEQDTELDILNNKENTIIKRVSNNVISHISLVHHILKTHPYITCLKDKEELEPLIGFFFISNTSIYFLSSTLLNDTSVLVSPLMLRKAMSVMLGGFFEKQA